MNKIAEHVLTTYRSELLSGKQIAYEGHVFMVTDSWVISSGKIVYMVFDNMSMKSYSVEA